MYRLNGKKNKTNGKISMDYISVIDILPLPSFHKQLKSHVVLGGSRGILFGVGHIPNPGAIFPATGVEK